MLVASLPMSTGPFLMLFGCYLLSSIFSYLLLFASDVWSQADGTYSCACHPMMISVGIFAASFANFSKFSLSTSSSVMAITGTL